MRAGNGAQQRRSRKEIGGIDDVAGDMGARPVLPPQHEIRRGTKRMLVVHEMGVLDATEVCVLGRFMRYDVTSCLFPDDEFPSGDRHRAHDQHAAEKRWFDKLAQELGDTPAANEAG